MAFKERNTTSLTGYGGNSHSPPPHPAVGVELGGTTYSGNEWDLYGLYAEFVFFFLLVLFLKLVFCDGVCVRFQSRWRYDAQPLQKISRKWTWIYAGVLFIVSTGGFCWERHPPMFTFLLGILKYVFVHMLILARWFLHMIHGRWQRWVLMERLCWTGTSNSVISHSLISRVTITLHTDKSYPSCLKQT